MQAGRPKAGGKAKKGQRQLTWNGKCSDSASTVCLTYNVEKGRKHPASQLHSDGTCKHRHVCDAFYLKEDGSVGQCGRSHPRYACDRGSARCKKDGSPIGA